MKYNRIFFFSFLIAVFVACSSTPEEVIVTLRQAEQCMEAYPDSALNLLRKISCPDKLSGQERADYVLLLTQARDKNYMDMSADSSITFAIDYFRKKNDKSKYGKALYYYGRVLHGKRETMRAMKVYWEARRVLKNTKEYKIMGLMLADMSFFYRDQSLYDEAIHCCHQAISYYYQAKDTLGVAYAYQTMGTSFFLKQEMDSVYQCVMTSLQLLTNNPVRLKINGSKILGKMYCFEKQYLKAEKVFLRILDEEPDKDMFVLHYMSLGRLYQMMGRKQDAEKYLKLSLDSDNLFTSSEAYECLAKLAKADHDYEQALILKGRSDSLLYIAENDRKREALVQLQVKYQKEEFETELLQGKLEKRGLHILYLIVVILFSGIVYFFYARYGRAKLEVIQTRKVIEKNNKQIASYQNEIGAYKQQKNETSVQCKVEELSRKMKVLITENEKLRSKIDVSTLIKMLKNGEVLVEKLTPEEWDKIFDLVNCLYSNSLIKLKSECTQLTKHDIKLLTFLFLGFTTKELKILFDSKDNHTIFKAKMRLKERLELAKDESVEDFLHKCQSDKLK